MTRIPANILLALMIATMMSGCCLRRPNAQKCCPEYVSQRGNLQVSAKPIEAGIVYDFGSIPNYDNVRRSLFDQLATGNVAKINLQEAVCLAARNSDLAELIDAERHSIKCQSGDGRAMVLDLILYGEALEQRNTAAGAAGELFLGLVQVNMQRKLIEESKLHLTQLEETIQAADEAGFATADGKNELAKGNIRVTTAESELNSAEQKLMYQLNLLINIDSKNLLFLQPVHQLTPDHLDFDVREQISVAESNRPGIRAIETAISSGVGIESAYELLNQFDPRLGIKLAPLSITRRLLRRQLLDELQQEETPDVTAETRQGQVQQILDTRKSEARISASQAMLNIQSSLERLAIINQDIARLNAWHQQLKAKQEIEAEDSYLELNQNWIELQQAKSDRITAAIEHETAKIKLLQAQGQLVQQCGYELAPICNSPNPYICE